MSKMSELKIAIFQKLGRLQDTQLLCDLAIDIFRLYAPGKDRKSPKLETEKLKKLGVCR